VVRPVDKATRGTWLYTRAGELDPLWLFLGAHLLLGVVLIVVTMFHGKQAVLAALAYNAVSILILAIIKVPIDRARLLAPALPKAMGALSQAVAPPFVGMDYREDDSNDTREPNDA
jgi:hypothetical protein